MWWTGRRAVSWLVTREKREAFGGGSRGQGRGDRVVGSAADVSLVGGGFPRVVVVLTMGTLAVGVVSARRRWRRLAYLALGVTAAMVAVATLIARLGLIAYTYPKSFYAWIGLVVFAAGLATVGWCRSGWWRRGVAVGAVAGSFLMAATLINQHYAYFPTPAALFGQGAIDEISAAHMGALTRTVSSAAAATEAGLGTGIAGATRRPTRGRGHSRGGPP